MKSQSLRFAVFTCIVAGTLACGRGGGEETVAGETIAVTVQPARTGSLRDTVSVSGTVVPAAVADFIVTADQPAEIAELPKNEGDTVKTGDLLVRLDIASITNEVATRQLELGEATAKLDAAKKDEERLEALVTQGLAARNKLEAARTTRLAAEAAVTQIKAGFDAAKSRETGAVIRARFPGVVIKRWHGPGETVAGGESDPILRVIDPARLQVAIQVPRAQAERINQGQPATIQTGTGIEPAVVAMKGAIATHSLTRKPLPYINSAHNLGTGLSFSNNARSSRSESTVATSPRFGAAASSPRRPTGRASTASYRKRNAANA